MLNVLAFTRELVLSVGVGAIEATTKLILYYLHERMWSFIGIGTKVHPLSALPVARSLEEKDMAVIENQLKDLGYISDC